MARNIEIKARARDFDAQLQLAQVLADGPATSLLQTDTFFNSSSGRLKLREFPDQDAHLIYYERADDTGPALSEYYISHTPNAPELKHTLDATLGVLAVIKKQRLVLMSGRTRLHFDQVQGLGHFIELEVVLGAEDSVEHGKREVSALMLALNIESTDLLDRAYIDLITDRR